MTDISNFLFGGGAGQAESPIERILRRQREVGFGTPGINPNAPDPRESLIREAQANNFGGPPVVSNVPQAAIERAAAPGRDSIVGGILDKLGGFGSAIRPAADFVGGIGDDARSLAERGGLSSLAPNFSAGVQGAAQAEVDNALKRAQTELFNAKAGAEGAGGSAAPLTEMAKLQRDFEAGLVSNEVYQAKLQELFAKETTRQFDQTKTLREEYNKRTDPLRKSQQSLAQAASLLRTKDNPLADLGSLISTIRAIDDSVVREGELATFRSMQGILTELEEAVSTAKGKGLTDTTRANIAGMISALEKPLADITAGWQDFYREEAGKARLDPNSVIGGAVIDIDVPEIQRDPVEPDLGPVDPNATPERKI